MKQNKYGEDMMEIKVEVFKDKYYCYIPSKLPEFFAFWEEKIALIPKEFIDSARIEIDATEYYDGASLEIHVNYKRPETEDEESVRLETERLRIKHLQDKEKAELKRLKDKYEAE